MSLIEKTGIRSRKPSCECKIWLTDVERALARRHDGIETPEWEEYSFRGNRAGLPRKYTLPPGWRFRSHREKQGFTLIEALIVLAIFSVTILLATNSFIIVTKNQSRFNAFQSVDEDARYALTFITRRIQFTTIDYDFYTQQGIDLRTQPTHVLALQNERQETEIFRKSGSANQWDGGGNTLELCIITGAVTCQNVNDWETITPSTVQVNTLQFFIAPAASPWTRLPDTPHIQPRVTIVYGTEDTDREATLNMQTTVVSRFYER